ncbi:MAG: hypothetical protein B6229_07145 [Spirochaetaceae bacterium 4572_7]|nr:MAG: hypothetical protein B6229_07145 [Spirochaetaceae bacterium 4572_7]
MLSFFIKIPFSQLVITSFAHSFGVATMKDQKYIACNSVVANPPPGEDVCICISNCFCNDNASLNGFHHVK